MKNHAIAVIGAGNMGSGIAQKYATHGHEVVVVDQNGDSLIRSKKSIADLLEQGVKRGVFKDVEAQKIFHRIRFTTDINECESATLVIEAIFEDIYLKQELFRKLETICKEDTVLATNTSSFHVADLQTGLKHPERVLGLHYFYHPAKNRLVEMIKTPLTNHQTWSEAKELQESINKIVIESKDAPGFIVNRFFVPWLNEAMKIVDEKIANIATVDAAAKEFFKISMGPFQLMNVTGLPITFHSCETFARKLGNFYAPSLSIVKKIEAKENWDLSGPIDHDKVHDIAMRLLFIVAAITCEMVFEDDIGSMSDVDLGARVGLLWHKGPFELLNQHLDEMAEMMSDKQVVKNLALVKKFREHLDKKHRFPHSHVVIKYVDDVGIIELNKPDTLNSLDVNLKNDLAYAFTTLLNQKEITGIVITGHRRAFMAGADLAFFNEHIAQKRVDAIVEFARSAQDLFLAIDQAKKPIVAAINGLALGGGLELALACDAIVSTKDAKMGFPETGIGIYPGLGGTQRTPRRIGMPLARYLILTGSLLDGATAHSMGLVDDVVDEKDLMSMALKKVQELRHSSKVSMQRDTAFADLELAFLDLDIEKQSLANEFSDRAKKAIARLAHKAPLAIALADQLIVSATEHSIRAGLELESSHLQKIFNSEDARTGLRAAMLKEPAVFLGK